MTIRPIEPADYGAVAELCVTAYAPFVAGDHVYVETLRNVAPRAEAAEVLVAAAGGAIVGTVTFVPDGGPLGEIATPDEAEFRMLAVDPAARGRGVAGALMERVLEASRARGKAGVVCSTLPSMHAAHRLYRRLGFRRVPGRDWSPVAGVDLWAFAVVL